jgi:hypothetical protein
MGISSSNYESFPKPLKAATQSESTTILDGCRYEACGSTVKEALDQLSNICICYNIPVPQPIPDVENKYYCGFINVMQLFKTKKRYNTVWFTRKNSMIVAFIYYPKF